MASAIQIEFDQEDRTYVPLDLVSGYVTVLTGDRRAGSFRHSGIEMTVAGEVKAELSSKSVMGSLKPFTARKILIDKKFSVTGPGEFKGSSCKFPFEFALKCTSTKKNRRLLDSYHGVYVHVKYFVTAKMKRGMLSGSLTDTTEIYVDAVTHEEEREKKQTTFSISPQKLRNISTRTKEKIPKFLFEGQLASSVCNIYEPFGGEFIVRYVQQPIKSIELQLVRIERGTVKDGVTREATEVQNIQVADGGMLPNLPIPLHMVFPKIFSCASLRVEDIAVDFEVNLIVIFKDKHMVTENFPIVVYRGPKPNASI